MWTRMVKAGWIGLVKAGFHQSVYSVPPDQCSLIIAPDCPWPRIIGSDYVGDRGGIAA